MLSDEEDHRDLIDLIEQMLIYEPEKRLVLLCLKCLILILKILLSKNSSKNE